MDNNYIYNILYKYFNTLSTLGYKNYNFVYKLLALTFINNFINSECSSFITEDEYRIISKASSILMNSKCFPQYSTYSDNIRIPCDSSS